MPNLKNVTYTFCGLQVLDIITFGQVNYTNLESLNMQRNLLRKIENYAFKGLPNLQMLDLRYNKIEHIDANAFYELHKLKVLRISHNPINYFTVSTFYDLRSLVSIDLTQFYLVFNFDFFEFNNQLQNIYLGGNEFTDVYSSKINRAVQKIDLNNNRLNFFPTLSNMDSLKELLLASNPNLSVTRQAFTNVPRTLTRLDLTNTNRNYQNRMSDYIAEAASFEQLQYLGLGFNQFDGFDFDLLASNTELSEITLNGNNITVLNGTKTNLAVRRLDLSQNRLTDFLALSNLINLEVLFLSRNSKISITSKSFEQLTKLKELHLSFCSLHRFQDDYAWLKPMLQLEELNIGSNKLKAFDFDILSKSEQLKRISLSRNKLTKIQLTQLNKAIKFLSLDRNRLTNITALQFLENLEVLSLSHNANLTLTDVTFKNSPFLKVLFLDALNLYLRDDSFSMLAPLINLEILSMIRNEFKYVDFRNFPKLNKLETLYLIDNKISYIDYEDMREKLPKLKQLHIDGNDFECRFLNFLKMKVGVIAVNNICHNATENEMLIEKILQKTSEYQRKERAVLRTSQIFDDDYDEVCGQPYLGPKLLVVGGKVDERGTWPWLVSLNTNASGRIQYLCGASLISQKAIITAAHCIEFQDIDEFILYIGRYNLFDDQEEGFQVRKVDYWTPHPDYNKMSKASSDADIAIIHMDRFVSFSDYIQPVCLWPYSSNIQDVGNQSGVVVGWGRDADGNDVAPIPRTITLPVVADITCVRDHPSFIYITSERTFCAGLKDGTGPCNGDSGSGLLVKRDGRWVLRGLVSSALPDPITQRCDLNNYVVFTDVAKFYNWISESK